MIKKYSKILIYIIIVLIILGITVYFLSIKTNLFKFGSNKNTAATNQVQPVVLMTDAEKTALRLYHSSIYQVLSRDKNGLPNKYEFMGMADPEKIVKDLMADKEKAKFKIATSTNIQVLKRDNKGRALIYRVMKNASDTVELY